MKGYDHYKEKAFPLVYFISVYAIMFFSLIFTKLKADQNTLTYISYAIPQIVYISVTLIYTKIARVDFFKAMPINFKIKSKNYIWTVLLTISLFCFAFLPNLLIMYFFNIIGLSPSVNVPQITGIGNILLSLIIICIMPAIGEEFVFRGLLNSSFREYGGIAVILFSGLLFSLSHFNIAQTVYQFFIGVFLSYLYLKTNNLLIPMLIHFLNNLLALFIPMLIPFFSTMYMTANTFVVLVPMFIIGGFLLVLSVRKLLGDTYENKTIIVYEYLPGQDDFVAVATEKNKRSQHNNIIKKACYEIKQNFKAIVSIFDKQQTKEKITRFKELYPPRKKINIVIKIIIAAIIGVWLISIIL